MNAIPTTVLLADIAPRHEGGSSHTALVVVSVVLAVAVVVLVYAAFQRRK